VLFALVFVFFIGVELDGEKTNLYTFFGEYYKEMDTTGISSSGVTVSKWWKNLLETQTTLYGVFGTVISALTLLSVVGFAAVAAVKYILSWVKKTENTANGWAVASILSFVVGSLLFYAHLRLNVSAVDYADIFSAIGENAEIKFNGATAFGIAFSLACVGLGVIAATLSKGKTLSS